MKKVLILGAGLVAKPIVQYLLSKNFRLTVADLVVAKAEAIIGENPNAQAIGWSTEDHETLDRLVSEHDLTVSLLPYLYHVQVAKTCIKHGKNMVTTSYVKPEMSELDAAAKEANVIILNELGLDPGIDHMSAMRIIDHVHHKGGKVEEFYSICGALPAPECAENPFRYKFSWSPKGVVMASNNDAMYLKHGKEINIPTANLFKDVFVVDFPNVDRLDVYPNRDSVQYKDIYGIPETKTMYRGTFRYRGWCESLHSIKALGLTSYDKQHFEGMTYAQFLARQVKVTSTENLKLKVAQFLKIDVNAHAIKAIDWLGLFSNEPMNRKEDSPFEIVSDLMISKMSLGHTERDMVAMQHTFLASYPDGNQEVIKSSMLDFGSSQTDTSIARTVALPAAIGVELILNQQIIVKGVWRPVIPEIYNPVLNALEKLEIKMIEEYGLPLSEMIK